MCIVPGPASQVVVFKRVYASLGLQCTTYPAHSFYWIFITYPAPAFPRTYMTIPVPNLPLICTCYPTVTFSLTDGRYPVPALSWQVPYVIRLPVHFCRSGEDDRCRTWLKICGLSGCLRLAPALVVLPFSDLYWPSWFLEFLDLR
jgi:hypothetical protein